MSFAMHWTAAAGAEEDGSQWVGVLGPGLAGSPDVPSLDVLARTPGLLIDQSGVEELARVASEMNSRMQNIGARRLHTVLEKVLEEVSFSAPELTDKTVRVDANFVRTKLEPVLRDEDLSRYIL